MIKKTTREYIEKSLKELIVEQDARLASFNQTSYANPLDLISDTAKAEAYKDVINEALVNLNKTPDLLEYIAISTFRVRDLQKEYMDERSKLPMSDEITMSEKDVKHRGIANGKILGLVGFSVIINEVAGELARSQEIKREEIKK